MEGKDWVQRESSNRGWDLSTLYRRRQCGEDLEFSSWPLFGRKLGNSICSACRGYRPIPMRILYPNGGPGDGGGYGTDYYYAQLSETNWDVDGDDRWGEFNEDNLNIIYDVAVGRLPFNNQNIITNICNNTIYWLIFLVNK